MKIKVVCPKCGSDDVCIDAAARWDVDTQAWSMTTEFDDKTCQACGYEGHTFSEVRAGETTTLDEAIDAFEQAAGPNALTAANLLAVATQYFTDGMIGDGTYRATVAKVAADLRQSAEDEIDQLCERINTGG